MERGRWIVKWKRGGSGGRRGQIDLIMEELSMGSTYICDGLSKAYHRRWKTRSVVMQRD